MDFYNLDNLPESALSEIADIFDLDSLISISESINVDTFVEKRIENNKRIKRQKAEQKGKPQKAN